MKKLTILLIVIALTFASCDDSISKQEKRAARLSAKEKKELVETDNGLVATEEPVEITEERVVHVIYTTASTDSSYWYVVMKDDVTNWHGTVSLATPYFDFKEAKRQFEGAKGKCYFKFILQINKESLESWNTYND